MRVLGIESSCDETAAAIVQDDGLVLADAVASQIALHAPYGGVVPELASRAHLTNLTPVVHQVLAGFDGKLSDLDGIAITHGPGLMGALLVGVQAAKAMALCSGLPLVGVNHLVGHLLSVNVHRPEEASEFRPVPYPYVALLVSGGHTALYEVRSDHDIEQLGQTRDDAAGEAFDKVAKLVGLGYPGGPRVDRLAADGDPSAVALPMPMAGRRGFEFSFSGLKTAVAQHVRRAGVPEGAALADLCASFQQVVVKSLVSRALYACKARAIPRLVITGGVAANRGLRTYATERAAAGNVDLFLPPFHTCTDNAAMIAYAGACRLRRGMRDDLDLAVFSRSPMLGVAEGEAARRRYRSQRLPR